MDRRPATSLLADSPREIAHPPEAVSTRLEPASRSSPTWLASSAMEAETERTLEDDEELPEGLLRAGFLCAARDADPLEQRAREAGRAPRVRLESGTAVGRYTILHHLGDGGMGAVYAAEQADPHRRVALKIVPAGLGGAELVRRFRLEARLLASLQHPGIARILEAGAVELPALGTSVHYLAMELVEGERLDAHARGLDLRDRIELLARTCDAVQHAHQRGIIHRDLKPGNVLVACADAEHGLDERVPPRQGRIGTPVVLDFGIGRVLEEFEPEATQHTLAGQMLGTPAYMAPEQAAGEPDAIDTRADVYSLGVVLFEALTGALPIDVRGVGMLEAARRVREVAPARPSRHDPRLAGEVDAIVLRALAKAPDERYPSAGALAADLRRHLAGEPIEAQPPTALALLFRAVRRNRALFLGAGAFVVLLALFAAVSALQARENRRLADSEGAAREALGASAAELSRSLGRSRIERARMATVVGDLTTAEALLWHELLEGEDPLAARWGLRELYRRYPLQGAADLPVPFVWSILLLADGNRVLTAAHDGRLRAHALPGLEPELLEPAQLPGRQNLFASSSGRFLVHGAELSSAYVLDAASLALLHTIEHPRARAEEQAGAEASGFTAFARGPGLDTLVVGDPRGTLRTFDLATGAMLDESADGIDLGIGGLGMLARSPDGALLAAGTYDGRVAVYADPRKDPLLDVVAHERHLADLMFNAAGTELYSGGSGDRRIRRFDLATGALLGEWQSANGSPRQLALDVRPGPGEGRLLGGGWWSFGALDTATGVHTTLVPVPTDSHLALADRGQFLTGGAGRLWLWGDSVVNGRAPAARVAGKAVVRFLPGDGERVLLGDSAGRLAVWRPGATRPERELDAGVGRLRSFAVAPDGNRAFVAGLDGALAEIELAGTTPSTTGLRVLRTVRPALALSTSSLALSDDGLRLAFGVERGRAEIRSTRTGETLHALDTDGFEPTSFAFLPDGGLAVAARERQVLLFDAQGVRTRSLQSDEDLWAVAAARERPWVAATSWEGSVFVWNRDTGARVAKLTGRRTALWDVAFRPGDEERIAACGGDGVLVIFDVASGRELFLIDELQRAEATSLAFRADGDALLVGAADGRVLWIDLLALDVSIEANRARFVAPQPESAGEQRR